MREQFIDDGRDDVVAAKALIERGL